MKGQNIADRLLEHSARVVELVGEMRRFVGRHIAQQVIRSSTAAGANYEEARGAESRNDFVHKLAVAIKELRETLYWLRLISRLRLIAVPSQLLDEGNELIAILAASRRTAQNS